MKKSDGVSTVSFAKVTVRSRGFEGPRGAAQFQVVFEGASVDPKGGDTWDSAS